MRKILIKGDIGVPSQSQRKTREPKINYNNIK